ncbi:MAG: peptidylprolyl isomerase [Pirellula sp.]|nr:peptidylprolyl isomerase [Pirellula sp.]
MTVRAQWLGFGFSLVATCVSTTILFGQEPPKTSNRPDIPWLNEEIFKKIEPQLREYQKNAQANLPQNLEGKAKGALSPEQRKAAQAQAELMETAELIAREQTFGVIPESDVSQLAVEYRESLKAFSAASVGLIVARNRHVLAYNLSPEQNVELEDQWHQAIATCHKTKKVWLQKGAELYASSPQTYANIGKTLQEAFLYDVQHDRFDGWVDPLMLVISAGGPIVTEELLIQAISVCIANNRYTDVDTIVKVLRERGLMDDNKEKFAEGIPPQMEKWNKELDRRKSDSEKGNNPIVELRTSKGIMKIELFEDDAPEAVNSFIYLVERKYYDLKPFFRVEKGLVAQTGCEKGDGSGSAGYTIRGEADLPTKRNHFRGSLAVALGGDKEGNVDRNSGSSQFYISKTDLPHLDEDYTVFGRVIEGIECLGLLRQLDLSKKEEREANKRPDIIISAKVIRKRDHIYKPSPATGRVFGMTSSPKN